MFDGRGEGGKEIANQGWSRVKKVSRRKQAIKVLVRTIQARALEHLTAVEMLQNRKVQDAR